MRAVGDADIGERLVQDFCIELATPSSSISPVRNTRAVVLHGALHLERADRAVATSPLAWRSRSRRASAQSAASLGRRLVRCARARRSRRPRMRGGAAEHDQIEQRVGAQAVGAVHRHAGRLADRHQPGHDRVRDCRCRAHHFAAVVGRNAAHVVVDGRQNRDRLLGDVDSRRRSWRSRRCRAGARG